MRELNVIPRQSTISSRVVIPQVVKAAIDTTIDGLAKKRFACDPIIPERYSRVTSVMSSAYKRHGNIIDLALRTALISAGLSVWQERKFLVSEAADKLAESDDNCDSDLRYGDGARTIQIDLIMVCIEDTIRAYECKRGFGKNDAGKMRSMLRDLRCTKMLLRSYGRQRGIDASISEARAIFYYGQHHDGLGPAWSLTRDDLDDHFGLEVVSSIEAANRYFSDRLADMLENAE